MGDQFKPSGLSRKGDQRHQYLQRYVLIVSYDGTRYSGFQRQSSCSSAKKTVTEGISCKRRRLKDQPKKKIKNRNVTPTTIQETLEDTLEFYTGLERSELKFRFAGRTDRGVHARGQVVVVSLPRDLEWNDGKNQQNGKEESVWRIRKSINSRLPSDISIEKVSKSHDENFDPRMDAKRKRYSYLLRYRQKVTVSSNRVGIDRRDNGEESCQAKTIHPLCTSGGLHLLRTAFDSTRVWLCPWSLDDSKLQEFCGGLKGAHDFSAFVHKAARKERDNHMTIERLDYERVMFRDDVAPIWEVRFLIEAKGFGRSQVRNMVGFLVDLCRGSFEDKDSNLCWLWREDADVLAKRINAAPACGLCLEKVVY